MSNLELSQYVEHVLGWDVCEYRSDIRGSRLYPPDFYVDIPCGRCEACRKRKRGEWSVRLLNEIDSHSSSAFLTLTLDDDSLASFKDDPKRPLKLFIDRLRKHLGFRPRYWFISELGPSTGRLHYHGIIFGADGDQLPQELVAGCWKYGFVYVGYVNYKTANYITKYMLKCDVNYKPFILCSQGIGLSYVNDHNRDYHLNGFDYRGLIKYNDRFYPLSTYYKRKFFGDDIRLCLMLNRCLDTSPTTFSFRGRTFTNEDEFKRVREQYYRWTLKVGLSFPITKKRIKDTLRYGKLCFPESGS